MLLETKQRLRRVTLPLARLLASMKVSPNALTLVGLALMALAGAALAFSQDGIAFTLLVLGLLCDLMDGEVARLRKGGGSRFGAFLDSTVDRVSEAFIFTGLLLGHARQSTLGASWILIWALAVTGGFLVSYTRARAEGLGLSCRIGIADRSLRMAFFLAMVLLGPHTWEIGLAVLSILSWVTVGQRINHVRRQVIGRPAPVRDAPNGAPPAERDESRDRALAVSSR